MPAPPTSTILTVAVPTCNSPDISAKPSIASWRRRQPRSTSSCPTIDQTTIPWNWFAQSPEIECIEINSERLGLAGNWNR